MAVRPLQFYTKCELYSQSVCHACEWVVTKPVAAIIDRGQADASLLAQVVIAKYCPYIARKPSTRVVVYRCRSRLVEWVGVVGVALRPLADHLGQKLRQ
jgi:transposase